jgi:phenylacetate-CoA ligase
MSEAVAAASECEHGQLHLWPEVGFVEVLGQDDGLLTGESGDLVCTGLLNADMPLIRYLVGDIARLAEPDACACGCQLIRLAAVEGRRDDVVITPDGRRIGRLDPVFKDDLPIREAQIIQERIDHLRVRYVPGPAFGPASGQAIARRLRDRLGDVQITLEPVEHIPRSPNGKFRAVISQLPKDVRERGRRLPLARSS